MMIAAATLGMVERQDDERDMSMSRGLLGVEPHPLHADSAPIITVVSTGARDPLGRGMLGGSRNVVSLLGPERDGAAIIEAGRVRLAAGSMEAALRVIRPAVRM